MTNERYLIISYFVVAALSVLIGLVVYAYLRRPFQDFLAARAARNVESCLRRLFPLGFVLPALLGFLSVSYWSCNANTYEKIVRDREYLIQKNHEQLSAVLFALVMATLFWDLTLIVIQKYGRPRRDFKDIS